MAKSKKQQITQIQQYAKQLQKFPDNIYIPLIDALLFSSLSNPQFLETAFLLTESLMDPSRLKSTFDLLPKFINIIFHSAVKRDEDVASNPRLLESYVAIFIKFERYISIEQFFYNHFATKIQRVIGEQIYGKKKVSAILQTQDAKKAELEKLTASLAEVAKKLAHTTRKLHLEETLKEQREKSEKYDKDTIPLLQKEKQEIIDKQARLTKSIATLSSEIEKFELEDLKQDKDSLAEIVRCVRLEPAAKIFHKFLTTQKLDESNWVEFFAHQYSIQISGLESNSSSKSAIQLLDTTVKNQNISQITIFLASIADFDTLETLWTHAQKDEIITALKKCLIQSNRSKHLLANDRMEEYYAAIKYLEENNEAWKKDKNSDLFYAKIGECKLLQNDTQSAITHWSRMKFDNSLRETLLPGIVTNIALSTDLTKLQKIQHLTQFTQLLSLATRTKDKLTAWLINGLNIDDIDIYQQKTTELSKVLKESGLDKMVLGIFTDKAMRFYALQQNAHKVIEHCRQIEKRTLSDPYPDHALISNLSICNITEDLFGFISKIKEPKDLSTKLLLGIIYLNIFTECASTPSALKHHGSEKSSPKSTESYSEAYWYQKIKKLLDECNKDLQALDPAHYNADHIIKKIIYLNGIMCIKSYKYDLAYAKSLLKFIETLDKSTAEEIEALLSPHPEFQEQDATASAQEPTAEAQAETPAPSPAQEPSAETQAETPAPSPAQESSAETQEETPAPAAPPQKLNQAQLLHAYYQEAKERIKKSLSNQIKNCLSGALEWRFKDQVYSSKNYQVVDLDGSGKLYGVINPSIKRQITDLKVLNKFECALRKGLVGPKGENGVKVVWKKSYQAKSKILYELKPFGCNDRVVATKLIKSTDADAWLAIFDKCTDHAGASSIEPQHIHYIESEHLPDQDFHLGSIGQSAARGAAEEE